MGGARGRGQPEELKEDPGSGLVGVTARQA